MDQTTKTEDYYSSGNPNNLNFKTQSNVNDRKMRALTKRESFDQKTDF